MCSSDLGTVRREPRPLADQAGVYVQRAARELADHHPEQVEGVSVPPLLLVGGKELAQVAEAAGAEQGVDHRVREDVGVRVPGEPAVVLDLDSADHQRLPLGEPVAVVTDPDPERHLAALTGAARLGTPAGLEAGSANRLQPPPPSLEDADPLDPEVREELERLVVAVADMVGGVRI